MALMLKTQETPLKSFSSQEFDEMEHHVIKDVCHTVAYVQPYRPSDFAKHLFEFGHCLTSMHIYSTSHKITDKNIWQ